MTAVLRLYQGVESVGATLLFAWEAGKTFLKKGVRFHDVVLQMYMVGVRSVPTTLFISLFVGAIMAIQINLQVRDFGAQGFLGGLSTSVTIRNIGPVLIAFVLSGKVGAYTSAELGTMKVTDQINAIRCLGSDPIQYLIVPRLIAVILSSFMLLVLGLFMTVAGGIAISHVVLNINALNFLSNIPQLVSGWSVGTGLVKSFAFGCLIGIIGCYRGYATEGGAAGVGRSVRRAAVETLVSIILVDYALSTVSEVIYDLLRIGYL